MKIETLIQKVSEMKKSGAVDLSTEEDLSIAVMNLVSIEEHLFFTSEKTGKGEYLDLLNAVRNLRKGTMEKLVPRHEGETWCISKHLLAAAMRLMEVATKLKSQQKEEEAKVFFGRAYETYSMFWAIRLKLIDAEGFKETAAGLPWSYKDIVEKLVDCCEE